MRRPFWVGVIVGLSLSLMINVSVQYGSRHPSSFPGQSLTRVCQLGADCCHSVAAVSLAMADRARQCMPVDPALSMYETVADPQPVASPCVPVSRSADEQIELIKSFLSAGVAEVPVSPPAACPKSPESQECGEPADSQKDISPTKAVPECPEDADGLNSGCPDASDPDSATAADAFLSYWMRLFDLASPDQSSSLKCKNRCATDSCPCVEVDAVEESEAPSMSEPPASPEDPAMYHHHAYPSDSVVCPYTGRSYPLEEPKEPTPPAGESKSLTPSTQPPSNPQPPEAESGSEESSAHPEVDTMEFRPSDAEDGEFDTNPL